MFPKWPLGGATLPLPKTLGESGHHWMWLKSLQDKEVGISFNNLGPWYKVLWPHCLCLLSLETNPSSEAPTPTCSLSWFYSPIHLFGFCLNSLESLLVLARCLLNILSSRSSGKGYLRRKMGLLLMKDVQLLDSSSASAGCPLPSDTLPQVGNEWHTCKLITAESLKKCKCSRSQGYK